MVNSRKLLVAFSAGMTLICRAMADVQPSQDNQDISRRYSVMCEQLVEATGKGLFSEDALIPFQSTHRAIKLAGHLRCQKAHVLLLDNLAYTPWQKRTAKEYQAFTNFNFCAGVTGERLVLPGRYPAVAALLHIGIPFSLFSTRIKRYAGYEKDEALSILGLCCGGRYYFKYAGRELGGEVKFFPLTKQAPPYELPLSIGSVASYGGIEIGGEYVDFVKEYDTMQKTLVTRFATEKRKNSVKLFDTIATMGFIRSLDAIPVLADNLTICPQASTNAPGGFVFPAAEALIAIGPAIGDCFERLKATKPLSVEETLWLRISHELYPEGLEYELYCAVRTNDLRAARLMQSLPWRRLTEEDMEDP